jgi:hypothetical protein
MIIVIDTQRILNFYLWPFKALFRFITDFNKITCLLFWVNFIFSIIEMVIHAQLWCISFNIFVSMYVFEFNGIWKYEDEDISE